MNTAMTAFNVNYRLSLLMTRVRNAALKDVNSALMAIQQHAKCVKMVSTT